MTEADSPSFFGLSSNLYGLVRIIWIRSLVYWHILLSSSVGICGCCSLSYLYDKNRRIRRELGTDDERNIVLTGYRTPCSCFPAVSCKSSLVNVPVLISIPPRAPGPPRPPPKPPRPPPLPPRDMVLLTCRGFKG